MSASKLQDDLLREYREERTLIQNQLALLEPMALSLRKPAAKRLANKGLIILAEIMCWTLMLASIAFAFLLNKLYPFYLLSMLNTDYHIQKLGSVNVRNLQWGVCALAGVIAFLFYIIARILAKVRKKNDILSLAGRDIKTIMGQHLNRKAAIETIDERHFKEGLGAAIPTDINDIPNPGY